jgi:hypothetical protein
MEYRGYDSAGLEIDGDEADKPMIFKEVGKVAMLREKCLKAEVDMDKSYLSQTSIAHTRYVLILSSYFFPFSRVNLCYSPQLGYPRCSLGPQLPPSQV